MHPIFLLTNATLLEAYQALVGEIGFGAVVAFDEDEAIAESYNDFYLPWAMATGLEVQTFTCDTLNIYSTGMAISTKFFFWPRC